MKRRQFTRSCVNLAMWGAGSSLVAMKTGCENNPVDFSPAYIKLHESGELKKRGDELWKMMNKCCLCPRNCGARRLDGEEGVCRSSSRLEISSFHPHFGEEKPLVGTGGSGAVYFTNCGLRCVFCINWPINHRGIGESQSITNLAKIMLSLQRMGCHNINLVTPTHYSPHIVLAIDQAAARGLRLPLVYNTSGWERPEILKVLDGIVDIYLPDFKYSDSKMAGKYSAGADTYPEITQKALLEMHRQVGVARPAADGLVYRGLIIRHLVMPNNVSGPKGVFEWIALNLPKDTYVNIMSQYRPMYQASGYPAIARKITRKEYRDAVTCAKNAGLDNLDIQSRDWLK